MQKKYNIAVVGATGNTGRETLNILAERNFPINQIYAIASRESIGTKISFGEDKTLKAQTLDDFDFSKVDIVFSCAGAGVSKQFAAKAVAAGAVVIDKSPFFRMNPDVPLIIPEVNGHKIGDAKIIANPNCVAIPVCMALKPLDSAARIKKVVISTYQSTSGAGKEGMDELYEQTKGKYLYQESTGKAFERQIAFNVIPKIGDFEDDGYTEEELKITQEVAKIMGDHVRLTATCVRVPVFVGHAVSINVEFEREMTAREAYEILAESDGLTVLSQDGDEKYVTPIEIIGEDSVFISRIRDDNTTKNAINMWVACDNLRKGAALNSVQIAEELLKIYDKLLKKHL